MFRLWVVVMLRILCWILFVLLIRIIDIIFYFYINIKNIAIIYFLYSNLYWINSCRIFSHKSKIETETYIRYSIQFRLTHRFVYESLCTNLMPKTKRNHYFFFSPIWKTQRRIRESIYFEKVNDGRSYSIKQIYDFLLNFASLSAELPIWFYTLFFRPSHFPI